jgi:hypothetical protein
VNADICWNRPILTPKTVLPLFFAVGIIFAPIGGLLLWASTEVGGIMPTTRLNYTRLTYKPLHPQIQEISIDYSDCIRQSNLISGANATGGLNDIPSNRISKTFRSNDYTPQNAQWGHYNITADYTKPGVFLNPIRVEDTSVCRLQFDIEHELSAPVFLYYRMTNFYQNHRRYVKSYDQGQLDGDAKSHNSVQGTDCAPLDVRGDKPVYPCGLIANSIFNDTFFPPVALNPSGGGNSTIYNMTNKGIAWSSDKDLYGRTKYAPQDAVPPPNWEKLFGTEYTEQSPPPNINEWEEFHVWMRTAGLPTFSKMALRQDDNAMPQGRYQMDIWDGMQHDRILHVIGWQTNEDCTEFNTTRYGGTKSILISTRTVMGGKNPFLGIAYLVVGGLCILLGALFTVTYIVKPRYVIICVINSYFCHVFAIS